MFYIALADEQEYRETVKILQSYGIGTQIFLTKDKLAYKYIEVFDNPLAVVKGLFLYETDHVDLISDTSERIEFSDLIDNGLDYYLMKYNL